MKTVEEIIEMLESDLEKYTNRIDFAKTCPRNEMTTHVIILKDKVRKDYITSLLNDIKGESHED